MTNKHSHISLRQAAVIAGIGFLLSLLRLLVYRSGFIPRVFSILLFIAAAGYFINSVGVIIDPELPAIIWNILAGPCLIGELALMVWLVFRGGKQVSSPENISKILD